MIQRLFLPFLAVAVLAGVGSAMYAEDAVETQPSPLSVSEAPLAFADPPRPTRIIIIYDDPAVPDTISNRFEWAWNVAMGDSLGYELVKWRLIRNGLPPKSVLENHDAVVWTTTEDILRRRGAGSADGDRSCLTPEEEALLDDYLRNPSPGIKPALLIESLDYLNELMAEGQLSVFADSVLKIDEVRVEDYPLATSVEPACGEHGTATYDLQQYGVVNRTDSYRVDPEVRARFLVSGTDHIVSHVVTDSSYSAGYSSNMLVAVVDGDYPSDDVTQARWLLTLVEAGPNFSVEASVASIRGAPGDTVRFETTISNGMLVPYGDRSPGSLDKGFGLHPLIGGLGTPLGLDKVSIPNIDPGETLVLDREVVIPSGLAPGGYPFQDRLGYAMTDTVRVARIRLVVE